AIASAAFVTGLIPLTMGMAHPTMGIGTDVAVQLGGPFLLLLFAAVDAVIFPVTSLFFMSWTNRFPLLWIVMIAAIAVGVVSSVCEVPIDPLATRMLVGFGAIGAIVLMLRKYDLLSTATAPFVAALISMSL